MFQESTTVELKAEFVDDLKKEIIAFANVKGGTIYVGVTDQGSICGIEDYDLTSNRISQMVRDAIKPDLTRFVDYEHLEEDGKSILKITVLEGLNKPYYLAKNGLKPSGVYVRQGNECAQASDEMIRQMIKLTDGDSFENCRSISQELTFESAKAEFEKRHMILDHSKELSLGLIGLDGLFTNIGLLLADQCPYTIKCAVFGGSDQSEFRDRREFSGSLFKQMEDCFSFIDLNNPMSASFEGLYRNDQRDFPEQAVREALLNSLVHRDYSYSASSLISIYADRMEFISVGGLLPGIQLQDVMMGVSICRNKRLAEIFYRMKLIEAYGTGLQKIQSAYKDWSKKPEILTGPNTFKIILPRRTRQFFTEKSLSSNEERILQFLAARTEATRSDIDHLLGVSQATSSRLLAELVLKGRIEKTGNGKTTKYRMGVRTFF